jgi:hypothetical protein
MAEEHHDEESLIEDIRSRSALTDLMKKVVLTGIGAIFMTEESVKRFLGEAKLPREIANYLQQNAQKAKDEFFSYMAKEIAEIVTARDFTEEFRKFFERNKIRVTAEIEFTPRSKGSKAKRLPEPERRKSRRHD